MGFRVEGLGVEGLGFTWRHQWTKKKGTFINGLFFSNKKSVAKKRTFARFLSFDVDFEVGWGRNDVFVNMFCFYQIVVM